MSVWEELRYFKRQEFEWPEKMDHDFLRMLDELRHRAGVPMYVSSDYRNDPSSAHGHGVAVDVVDDEDSDGISSQWRYAVMKAAYGLGIPRIGDYDKHIHIDAWVGGPQGVEWRGVSA